MAGEKLIAQAKAYYIIGFGRDSIVYDDKRWVIGRIYFTDRRIIFKRFDKVGVIEYSDIAGIEEKDKYFRVSPPMGWSRGSILEIKHYEAGKAHVLTTLISGEFDVVTTMRGIISRFAMGADTKLSNVHKKILVLVSLGIKDKQMMGFLADLAPAQLNEILQSLKLEGFIYENLTLTPSGRKLVSELRKNMGAQEKIK